jgi:hypothetical protein
VDLDLEDALVQPLVEASAMDSVGASSSEAGTMTGVNLAVLGAGDFRPGGTADKRHRKAASILNE